jgi:hypothetical protein
MLTSISVTICWNSCWSCRISNTCLSLLTFIEIVNRNKMYVCNYGRASGYGSNCPAPKATDGLLQTPSKHLRLLY